MSVTGRLIGRSGDIAGKKIEISRETRIGRAPGSDIILATDAHARLFIQDDTFYIEGSGISVDGTPVQGAVRLDRMHVIEVGGTEIVFTRTAGTGTGTGTGTVPEPAPAPAPAPNPAPPKQPESGGTMIDMVGFGALPELGKRTPPAPAPAPAQNVVPPKQPESGGTMIDMVGFGALPELGQHKPPAPAPAPAPESAPEPAPAPPPAPAPAPDMDLGATVPMQAFIPSPPQWVLAVTVPGQGAVTYPLKVGDNVVGRGEGCDIKIPDPEQWLSRKHANVRVGADGSVNVVDLKGINGTFVQGVRVDTAPLQAGGTFVLGPHLEFKLQER